MAAPLPGSTGTLPTSTAAPSGFTGAAGTAYNQTLAQSPDVFGTQTSVANANAVAAMTPAEKQAYYIRYNSNNANHGIAGAIVKYGPAIMAAIATAGVGSGVGAAVGGGLTGGAVGGAAAGATTALTNNIVNGTPLTLGNLAKDTLVGAATGTAASLAKPAVTALSSATGLPTSASQAIVKGGVGALGAGLSGASPLAGAVSGAAGSLIASGAGSLGASSGVASSIGKLASGAINSAVAPSNVSTGVNAGLGALGTVGSLASGGNGNMATTATGAPMSSTQTGLGIGNSLLGTVGGLVGAAGGIEQGNANGNVLSNATNAASIGTNTGYTGPNSTATINNGQVSTGLTGGLNTASTNLGGLAGQQSGIASSFNGITPANVQGAINSQAGQVAPTGTQGQLNAQSGLQGQVQGSETGLIGAATNQFNNPLTSNLQSAAQTQLGTAGSDFTNTYNTQLAALNQQLALPAAQAQSQLNDAEFGRGQLGTSGGALQTQAFATGLGQAFLGNQQTAFNEATTAQNSATNNAATLNAGANSNLNTANSLLANAYGQFNNTSALNTNTANSIFNQNSQISQLGNQYGQQNLNNQITSAALPAQLAGAYGANANTAITGATGLNNIANAGASSALAAGTQQGNQANNANANAARIVSSGATTNGLTGVGAALNGIGSTNLLGGIGSAFNALTGGTANTQPIGTNFTNAATTGDNSLVNEASGDVNSLPDPSYDTLDFGP